MGAEGSSLAGAEAALVDGEHHRGRGKVAQRREHSLEFTSCIAGLNADNCRVPPAAAPPQPPPSARIQVAVRKRPLFPHEQQKGDFDVVGCGEDGVWLHRTMMRADLRHMVCESLEFAFADGVFSAADDTDTVFSAKVQPLVLATTGAGGVSTVMCFGQTGSGKTFTTNGVADRAAAAIFASLPAGSSVALLCVEVAGAKIRDLLSPPAVVAASVTLLEDREGRVHLKGAQEVGVANAEGLRELFQQAQSRRAAAATGVHDASSRSHSVCRVVVRDDRGAETGRLDLVTTHALHPADRTLRRSGRRSCCCLSAVGLSPAAAAAVAGGPGRQRVGSRPGAALREWAGRVSVVHSRAGSRLCHALLWTRN
jgi:kinesin family protein 2/24